MERPSPLPSPPPSCILSKQKGGAGCSRVRSSLISVLILTPAAPEAGRWWIRYGALGKKNPRPQRAGEEGILPQRLLDGLCEPPMMLRRARELRRADPCAWVGMRLWEAPLLSARIRALSCPPRLGSARSLPLEAWTASTERRGERRSAETAPAGTEFAPSRPCGPHEDAEASEGERGDVRKPRQQSALRRHGRSSTGRGWARRPWEFLPTL